MASTLRQDVDFNGLFKKLGHHLEEIRVRALENILSKLEHKLVCESDLVQERHLLIRLLEWFNFPKSPRHSDVLNLILKLSQHTSASEILQDVGGIEFLTTLRGDVTPALQPLVDQILENTMRLPDTAPDLDHAPQCIYQKHNHTGMTAGVETTVDTAVSREHHNHTAATATSAVSHPETPGALPDYREPPLGFFDREPAPPPPVPQATQAPAEPAACFRMTIFPWLALTPTDRHVIVSTNTSLQSRDPALLVSTCEFLSDVVYQDFPAEIFLQRPNIIKNLMSLLSGPLQDMGRPRLAAIRTLADFAACLRSRIQCHQDPNLHTAKQDFSTTPSPFSTPSSSTSTNNNNNDGRPSVIGWTDTRHRGDGRDGDTSDSSTGSSRVSSVGLSPAPELDQMDYEDMPSLQYIQMTVPQFCALVMETALPLLKSNDEVTVTEVMSLLNLTLEIVVMIVTQALWEDNTMAARECADKFIESFDLIADLLKYHHHSNMPFDLEDSSCQGPADLVQHRLAYIGLGVFLTKFLKTLVPREKCRGIVTETLLSALNLLVYDETLSHAHPDLQLTLLGYLQQLDDGRYSVYVSTATICQAMQKTCRFLSLCQEEASRLSKETLSLCEGAFPSLPYHHHLAYITDTVRLCSDVCSKSQHYETLQTKYRKLVIRLLAHPVSRIRLHAYTTLLQTIQSNLSVAKASEPGSTSCDKVKFLLTSADMLYEIIVFGLADKDNKVCQVAGDVMSHLLKSQLLMSPDLWATFLQSVLRGLPVLQSYAGLTTVLGTTILSMLETRKSTSQAELPTLEKFRGTLRCMLASDIKVRSDALKRLSWFLTQDEGSGRKLPVISELDVTNLSNLFVVDTPRSVEEDLGRSVFQVDGLRKVYEIFTSLSVDPGVKKSAVDQLAIILQDQSLHSAFRKDGGFEKVLEHLQLGVIRDGDSNTNQFLPYLPGCMTILRHLVHHDYSLRHKLAHDPQIYQTLVRVALLHMRDDRTCYEVSHTLTLLLFDEQARFFMGGSKNTAFSVPSVVKLRYRLPFRPATHYETSPQQCAPPPDPDPLLTGLPLEMMRISWNVAWHNGMDTLVKVAAGNQRQDTDAEYSAKLKLTPTDRILLTTSHIRQGLQTAVYDIANATSHYAVSRSLTRILGHLVARHETEVIQVFHSMDWSGAVARFVKVTPSSSADESLLLDILRFLSMVLRLTNQVPDNILQWIGEVLYNPKGPLIGLLHRQTAREAAEEATDSGVSVKRSLDKSLLAFITSYNSALPYILTVRLKFHQLRGDLAYRLLQRLNVTDAPHFYNLASLEGTLQCLMHITARPGWSEECTEQESLPLCCQVLTCLLEVVFAFHIGRGGTSMSFMGKGVTKAATLCLRHLVYEMATLSKDQKWPKNWLYSRHGNDTAEESGLDWMLTLWAYRDAEVRTAGLGIAVTLSTVEEGRMLLTSNCKHIPGGIWAAAFSILLDQSECSMVRQQAALLLVNLTSESLPSGTTETELRAWQGPVVMDTECPVSLVGLPALLALLQHCQFYREMMMLLSSYYPQPTVQMTLTSDLYLASTSTSENTLSASGEAGLVPRTGGIGSHHNTMSLLQSSALSSVRPGVIGANGHASSSQTPPRSGTATPTAREQGQVGESGYDAPTPGEMGGGCVTTPCLVSTVAQLVRNLIIQSPADTVTALKQEALIPFFVSMIDAGFLEGIAALTTGDQLALFFTELVEMHTAILRLLGTSLVHDTSTRMDILQDRPALGAIVSLLRIFSDVSNDTRTTCCELWEAVLACLTTLLQMQCGPAVEVLAQVLQKQWTHIAVSIQKILDGEVEGRSLYVQCLDFLSVLCAEEGRLLARYSVDEFVVSVTLLLNQPLQNGETEDKDTNQVTAGSRFCKSLIGAYDRYILGGRGQQSEGGDSPGIKLHVATTLRTLLAISQSAKATALENGLVENLVNHVRQTLTRLSMSALHGDKGVSSTRGRDDPNIQELVLTFDLLRNFMFHNEDVKMACYHSGLPSIVHKLWSWCQMDPTLMGAIISLLTTFTGSCPTATSSLAYTSPSTTSVTQTKSSLSANSLVHGILKYAAHNNHKEAMLKGVFGLLANLALSSECRNIIWKSNFLRDFSDLNPKKSKSSKSKGRQLLVEVVWLELLLNLSFSLEGQQMILKIPDSVDLLLEFVDCGHARQQECAVIILRNLACHSSNKPRLLANEKLLPRLLQCVEANDDKIQTVAASGLWALVYNNQKAKVIMKNANVAARLQEQLSCAQQVQGQLSEKCCEDIQAVIQTVSD